MFFSVLCKTLKNMGKSGYKACKTLKNLGKLPIDEAMPERADTSSYWNGSTLLSNLTTSIMIIVIQVWISYTM